MRLLKGVYFWTMATTVTSTLWTVCLWQRLQVIVGLRPDDGQGCHRIASLWGRTLVRLMPGWRLEVEGVENLPPPGQAVVIVANHESAADIFSIYFLGIQFRWLSKDSVFKIPMVGNVMRWCHYVPVRRGDPSSHSVAMAQSAGHLRDGVPMLFFPEGTRSKTGTLLPFKTGAFRLAQDTQVPVLPIVLAGTKSLLPKNALVPGKARVRIKVLAPLPPPVAGDDLRDFAARVRAQIMAERDRLAPSA